MKQLARLVTVKVGGKEVAGLKQCDFNPTTKIITSQVKADNGPKDEAVAVDWTVTISGEVGRESDGAVGIAELDAMAKGGDKPVVDYVIGDLASYGGNALVSAFSLDGSTEDIIKYSATFTGVSKLTKKTA